MLLHKVSKLLQFMTGEVALDGIVASLRDLNR